jgi:signal peptidase II
LFAIGVCINYFATDKESISFKKVVLAIIALSVINEAIEIIIVNNQELNIPIIKDWLEIYPYYNRHGSFLGAFYGINIPLPVLVLLVAILVYILYSALLFWNSNRYFLFISLVLLASGTICSFMDKIIYGSSYDYIFIDRLLVFDLKDFYMELAICVALQASIYNKTWAWIKNEMKTDPFSLKYFRYEHNKWRGFASKIRNRASEKSEGNHDK